MSIFTIDELLAMPKDAIAADLAGEKFYFDPKRLCPQQHVCERYTNSWKCVICSKLQSSEWHKNNPRRVRESKNRWNARNAASRAAYNLMWRRENKGLVNGYCADYRARKIAATLPDVDMDAIVAVYERAAYLNQCYPGLLMEVDHIVPLSEGGKHCVSNLQLLPRALNRSKGNQLDWVHPFVID